MNGFCKKELPCEKVNRLTYNDLLATLAWVTLPRLAEVVRAISAFLILYPLKS
jgi:hypothetical protein